MDLHHSVPLSKGGSNSPKNLIDLCKSCHRWVHKDINHEVLAKEWLAQQIQDCPVRVDNVLRSKLFEEMKFVVESKDLVFNIQSVYNSNSWTSYEVFLKCCYRYLKDTDQLGSKVHLIVLSQFINLYRRRPGISYQRAAWKYIKAFWHLYESFKHKSEIQWLKPKILYQEAYLSQLHHPKNRLAYDLMIESSVLEDKSGNTLSGAISRAQSIVIGDLEMSDALLSFEEERDRLKNSSDYAASGWADENIPMH
ncbi:MAG: HNH endonuclease, partial [Bacteroidota bacterium]